MRCSSEYWTLYSWIEKCHGIFLYRATYQITNRAPAHSLTTLIYTSESYGTLTLVHIPDPHSVVFWIGWDHILDDWMPLDCFALFGVLLKTHCWLCDMLCYPLIRFHDPKLDTLIIRGGSKQFLLEGTPLQICDYGRVPFDKWNILVKSFVVVSWEDSNRRCCWPVDCCEFTVARHSILFVLNTGCHVFKFLELVYWSTAQVSELLSLLFLCAWVADWSSCFGPCLDYRCRLLDH